MEDLSIHELLRLSVSKESIESIFIKRDTSVSLFKWQIESDDKFPIIYFPHQKEENVSDKDIKKIESFLNGNNSSYQIISQSASSCERMNSSIGTEAEFILRRLKGEKIFCSSTILKHKYLYRLMFKLGIET